MLRFHPLAGSILLASAIALTGCGSDDDAKSGDKNKGGDNGSEVVDGTTSGGSDTGNGDTNSDDSNSSGDASDGGSDGDSTTGGDSSGGDSVDGSTGGDDTDDGDDASDDSSSGDGAGSDDDTGSDDSDDDSSGSDANQPPTISGTPSPLAKEGEPFSFTPTVNDIDSDTLTFQLVNGPSWMSINTNTGKVTGSPSADDLGMAKGIVIRVSDGEKSADLKFDLEVAFNPVEQAIRTGDALVVENSRDLASAALRTIEANRTRYNQARIDLFQLNTDGTAKGDSLTAIDWDPTHDAAQISAMFGENEAILISNAANEGKTVYNRGFGVIGEDDARYMVLGGNPMRERGGANEQMHQFMQNAIVWLTGRNNFDAQPLKLVMAQMDESYWFHDATGVRKWLDQRYGENVSYNAQGDCDGSKLADCLNTNPDLLIISQKSEEADVDAVTATVAAAMAKGTPVLYLHWDGNLTSLGGNLFTLFNVSYQEDNYWKRLYLSGYDSIDDMGKIPESVTQVKTMLTHFENEDYAFDWSACDGENCSAVSGLNAGFFEGADEVRSIMSNLDKSKTDIFANEGKRYQKLLALLGDHYRASATYPMDKITTEDNAFLKSLYADYSVYNYRALNPAQKDMGNFSRSNFDHVSTVSKTIDMESKRYFRAAGVYALPGHTVKVTRLDSADVATSIFVNTQRSGATHQFEKNGYTRPKFLQTPKFNIKSGESITFTSTYGGPVQIEFGSNGKNVSFRFENVGEHPFWNGEEDNASFEQALAQGDYDWAELVTPGFEVHSKLDKMRKSMQDENWKTGAALAAGTMRYIHNFPHILAGFKGPGIDVVAEIHDFAAAHSLEIEHIDIVKHMNADQATCGYGCSGNPYDAYWEFSPIGHGDIHELGHGLERGRFRFSGWEGHASTNPYSYYSKSHYYLDTGKNPSCQSLPFESMFNVLRDSVSESDPQAYVQSQKLTGWSNGAGITIQMMMTAQGEGKLNDGWNLLPRLHILDRNFNAALASEEAWSAAKANLGFSQYSLDEAKSINSNDWMTVAVSYATGLDFRDYLSMWALPFSAKASAQVASFSLPMAPRKYYASGGDQFCYGLDKPSILVDGVQTWPSL
ncbi:ImpA family metalloprotease [Hahella sp. NBU794]|uniref:ImpA family metalloprotease n=1 Tax=Hahella sp. NBU794 TaxID=3422590 RepID=UPI003D6F1BF7